MNESITKKIHQIDAYFRSTDQDSSEKERFYSRIIKLNEEVGELCEAAMHEQDPHQRNKQKEIDFDSELADVIICSLLLAENRDKNISEVIDTKLAKQLRRFGLH